MTPFNKIKPSLQPISGIVTNHAISDEIGIANQLYLRIDLEVSGVTVVGSIAAKLQMRSPGGTYTDLAGANASVAITTNGVYGITQLVDRAADQANLPLRKMLRVVLTTSNAGDAVTVDKVYYNHD